MTVPGQTNGMSPFIDMLIGALDLSRVAVSTAYMIGTAGSALILTHAGVLYDRFGARVVGTAAAALLGASVLGLSHVDAAVGLLAGLGPLFSPYVIAVVLLSIGFLGARFFGQGVLSMVSRNMIMTWFNDRRGPANALLGTSIAVAFAGAPTLFNVLIGRYGWSGAWSVLGFVLFGFAAVVFLSYRDAPRRKGVEHPPPAAQEPGRSKGAAHDSEDAAAAAESHDATAAVESGDSRLPAPRVLVRLFDHLKRREPLHPQVDFTLKEAKRTWLFWIFCGGLGLGSLVGTGFTFHVVDLLGSVGLSREAALAVFVPSSLISVAIQMTANIASDFTRLKFLVVAQMLGVCAVSVAATLGAPVVAYWLAALGLATTTGLGAVVSVVAWPRYFGLTNLGAVSGFAFSWLVAGSALGPYAFSLAESLTGDYRAAALLFIVTAIALAFGALHASHPVRPQRA